MDQVVNHKILSPLMDKIKEDKEIILRPIKDKKKIKRITIYYPCNDDHNVKNEEKMN